MTDPWGVPQNDRPQDPRSSGDGYPQQNPYGPPQQNPYGAAPQFGAPVPPQYDPNAAQQQPQPPQFGGPVPPPFGAPPPPFGTPVPPQFGVPAPGQYDPNAMGAPGPYGYGYPVAPPRQSNGLALAGAITSFVPVVGLVLSIIGLVRSKALGGAGRTAATVGLALSLLFSAGWGFGIYKLANSTLADPGCITAEAADRNIIGALSSDDQALSTAEQSGDKAQITAAANTYLADVKSLQSDMVHSESIAIHANVKAVISKIEGDLAVIIDQFQQLMAGTTTDTTEFTAAAQALTTDGGTLDSLCTNAANG